MAKIKAFAPHITVSQNAEKPCYSIIYYDTSDKIWHQGFSSYNLEFVIKWLNEEFEEVELEFAEVTHGHWIEKVNSYNYSDEDFEYAECSRCGIQCPIQCVTTYCPNCGALMDAGGSPNE